MLRRFTESQGWVSVKIWLLSLNNFTVIIETQSGKELSFAGVLQNILSLWREMKN